jgi:hypothetical protein
LLLTRPVAVCPSLELALLMPRNILGVLPVSGHVLSR